MFRLLEKGADKQGEVGEKVEVDSGNWSLTDDTSSESGVKAHVEQHQLEVEGVRRRVLSRPKGMSDVATFSDDSVGASGNECVDRELEGAKSRKSKATDDKTRDDHINDAMQAEVDKGLAAYPSPDVGTQRVVVERFKALNQRVHDEGYYGCNYINYANEMCKYTALFTEFLVALRSGWYFGSAGFLGFFWQQIMFTAHDAGHRGIMGKFVPDTLIGIFIADFCCGLSIGWRKSSHNVHHLVTNSPEHDPDIQNIPLSATCPSQFRSVRSTYCDPMFIWDKACELLIPFQKYAYYPIMAVARFNLYILGWCHLLSPQSKNLAAAAWTRPAELVGMSCYWFVFGYTVDLAYLARLVHADRVRARLPHDHHDLACPDHLVSLGDAHQRPRRGWVFRSATNEDYDGRALPSLDGFRSRRVAVPGGPPLVSPRPATQLACPSTDGAGVLPGDRDQVHHSRFR